MTTPARPSVEVYISHRCPRMAEHQMYPGATQCACHPKIPVPCPDCYSLRITSERISYEPS